MREERIGPERTRGEKNVLADAAKEALGAAKIVTHLAAEGLGARKTAFASQTSQQRHADGAPHERSGKSQQVHLAD